MARSILCRFGYHDPKHPRGRILCKKTDSICPFLRYCDLRRRYTQTEESTRCFLLDEKEETA